MAGTILPASGYVIGIPDSGDQTATVMPDVDSALHKVAGHNVAALAYIKKFRSLPCSQMRFDYFEKKQMSRFTTLAADCISTATTVAVATGEAAYIGRNYLIKNEAKGDLAIVRYCADANTISTMTRSYGTTAAADWHSGDVIRILGPLAAEGQKMMDAWSVKPESVYNYCGVRRITMEISHIADIQKLYPAVGSQWDEEVREKTEMFALYEYEMFLHGERTKGSYNQATATNIGGLGSDTAAVDWVTGGVRWHAEQYAPANRFWKVNGTIDFDGFLNNLVYPFVHRGSEQKVLFIPEVVGKFMDKQKYGKLQMFPADKSMNLAIGEWTVFGTKTITLVLDTGLNAPPIGNPVNGSMVLGLDMGPAYTPAYRVLEKNHVRPINLADGADGKAAEIYGIVGLQMHNWDVHMWAEGITGVAA